MQKLIEPDQIITSRYCLPPSHLQDDVYFTSALPSASPTLLMLGTATWLSLASVMLVGAPEAGTSNLLDC